jgi:hypothetical protein
MGTLILGFNSFQAYRMNLDQWSLVNTFEEKYLKGLGDDDIVNFGRIYEDFRNNAKSE